MKKCKFSEHQITNNSAKQSVDKFRLENNKIFFEINSKLWDQHY